MCDRVDVLGVGVSAVSLQGSLAEISGWIDRREHHYVCVTGVHGVMESQRDPALLRIHNESGLTIADGMPMLWSGRIAGADGLERTRGSDLLLAVCELATVRGWRCFFYGGAPQTLELLTTRLQERFPALRIVGACSPPFRPLSSAENAAMVNEINASGADVVWVGLSTPKQEHWMAANRDALDPSVLLGVGMAFDIHAGVIPEAPRVIQNSGLEWLYRLGHEPRRLWRRYLRNNPMFLLAILRRRPFLRRDAGAQ
ncbi:MAG: WecB/TagA/CpsF family glycosyltransferase [Solirubrobacteraceae bacterium]